MNPDSSVFVAGSQGLVGSALVRHIKRNTNHEIITRSHKEIDLTNQNLVRDLFQKNKIFT